MSLLAETIPTVISSITPIILAFLGFKGRSRFQEVNRKLDEGERKNKKEHLEITNSIDYINSREILHKALTKVCNSSISYTAKGSTINSFKTAFTNAIKKLAASTLTIGFKFLTEDNFKGHVVVSRKEIRNSYGSLPREFVELVDPIIHEVSEKYFTVILILINDEVFNDKYDRFVDATIAFLREELMIITKHWWSYSNTQGK